MGFFNWLGDRISPRILQALGQSYSYRLGYKGAVWLDTAKPLKMYEETPEAQIVIKKICDMFSNGRIIKRDLSGIEVPEEKDKEFYKLWKKPNPLQSQNAFLWEYAQQFFTLGNQLIYKNKPSTLTRYPVSLTNVPAENIQPILTGRFLDQTKIEDIVRSFEVTEGNKKTMHEPNAVIWSKFPDPCSPIVGKSPLHGLKYALSNTALAYKFRNVIMAAEGVGMGIISGSTKDAAGALPMKKETKDAITKELQQSKRIDGQQRITVADGNVTFTPFTFPTEQLGLFQEVSENFATICRFFGVDINIFINSTYENKKNGEIATYQDVIIPFADSFAQIMTWGLGMTDGTVDVVYDHVSVLKTDNTKDIQNLKTQSETLISLLGAGLINEDTAQNLLAMTLGMQPEQIKFAQDQTVKILKQLSPLLANKALEEMSGNEIRSILLKLGKMAAGEQSIGAAGRQTQQAF